MDCQKKSFYIIVNPVDVFNPLVKFLACSEIDIDNLIPEDMPDYCTILINLTHTCDCEMLDQFSTLTQMASNCDQVQISTFSKA
jgi:hypothetical protein